MSCQELLVLLGLVNFVGISEIRVIDSRIYVISIWKNRRWKQFLLQVEVDTMTSRFLGSFSDHWATEWLPNHHQLGLEVLHFSHPSTYSTRLSRDWSNFKKTLEILWTFIKATNGIENVFVGKRFKNYVISKCNKLRSLSHYGPDNDTQPTF